MPAKISKNLTGNKIMKMNKSKMALCLLVATAATSSIMAHADSVSSLNTKVIPLTFVAPVVPVQTIFTNVVNPAAGVSISDKTELFRATTSSTAASYQLAQGLTMNYPLQDVTDQKSGRATLHGQINSNNTMKIVWGTVGSNTGVVKTINGVSYFVGLVNTPLTLKYTTDTKQTLAADNYTISVDGAEYHL